MSEFGELDFGLWELAVLALLRERPMHPYEILRVLKLRKKDDVLVLKRGSLYHAIRRLAAAKLIVEGETTREGLRPERTTYTLAPAGEAALTEALKALIATPRHEPSTFMGSLSFLVYLTPEEAIHCLERRVQELQREIGVFDERIGMATPKAGRINVVESEYVRAMRAAELKWVRDLLADIRTGKLTWDIKVILRLLRDAHARNAKTKGRK